MAQPGNVSHDFAHLLQVLRGVHEESRQLQPNCSQGEQGERIYRCLSTFQGGEDLLNDLAPETLGGRVGKLNLFAKNGLFLYEAARRVGDKEVAQQCLKAWGERYVKQIGQDEQSGMSETGLFFSSGGLFFGGRSTKESPEVDEQIARIERELVVPAFSENESLRDLFREIMSSKLGLDILLRKVPETEANRALLMEARAIVVNGLFQQTYSVNGERLLRRCAPEMRSLDLSVQKDSTDDASVERALRECPRLETLNLTGCTRLTPRCLESGHRMLKSIILTGTSIRPEEVSAKAFPALQREELINARVVSTLDLTKSVKTLGNEDQSWAALADEVRRTDVILAGSDEPFHNYNKMVLALTDRFALAPSAAKFDALVSLRDSYSKVQKGPHDMDHPEWAKAGRKNQFDPRFFEKLVKIWDSSLIWKPPLGKRMTEWLVEIAAHPDELKAETASLLWGKILDALRSPSEARLVQSLLLELDRNKERLSALRFGEKDLATHFIHEICRSSRYNDPPEKVELMAQALVVMGNYPSSNSEKSLGNLAAFFDGFLTDPGQPDSVYLHLATCAFLLKTPNEDRKIRLEKILKKIREDRVLKESSLPKLIAGCVQDVDIRLLQRGTAYAERLKGYRGIMNECVDTNEFDSLKKGYLDALCSGRLGDEIGRIQALLALHPQLPVATKESIERALVALDQERHMKSLVESGRLSPESVTQLMSLPLPTARRVIEQWQKRIEDQAKPLPPSFFQPHKPDQPPAYE